ncbi:hypothetical protein [Oceanibacterium hippocampi]|uniref:Uncharacterized protein n=1 Tax=Oceanibacterium hippocampi TaxID=745714 RepID=A0A1Y5SBR0_9PROT|nr:hypothetical protein [Oceanibacterium hippocampi]SLN36736.1 hypothetical protein OCH7691_01486 [Oceanibacterium hippocampi]
MNAPQGAGMHQPQQPRQALGPDEQNRIVAAEIFAIVDRCTQMGVDEDGFRSAIMTIAIATFVTAMGEEKTAMFVESLPPQIRGGLFRSFVAGAGRPVPQAQAPTASPIRVKPITQPAQSHPRR